MKVALCFHGLSFSYNDFQNVHVDSSKGLESFKRNLIDINPKCEIDIFFHTWASDGSNKLNSYNAKEYIVEDRKVFDKSHKKRDATYSRCYSLQKSLKLKKEYEITNKFVYDFVFVSRFDLCLKKKFYIQDLNREKFYSAHWAGKEGLCDLWFLMNSEISDHLADLYDNLKGMYDAGQRVSNHETIETHMKKYPNYDSLHQNWTTNKVDSEIIRFL